MTGASPPLLVEGTRQYDARAMPMNIASKHVRPLVHPAAWIALSIALSQVALLSACRGGEVELAPEVRPVRS